jgi:hypothetical protein
MITLFVRDTAEPDATPIFATADPEVLRQLVKILARRVEGERLPPKLAALRKPRNEPRDPDQPSHR